MGGVDFTPRQMSPYGDEHPPVCSSTGTHDISSNNMMKKNGYCLPFSRKKGQKKVLAQKFKMKIKKKQCEDSSLLLFKVLIKLLHTQTDACFFSMDLSKGGAKLTHCKDTAKRSFATDASAFIQPFAFALQTILSSFSFQPVPSKQQEGRSADIA